MAKDDKIQTTLRIPEELHTKARLEAVRTKRSFNDVLNELIQLWTEGKIKLEDKVKTEG